MKLDKDVKDMTAGEARQALMRVRRLIRTHKRKKGNARCFHNDTALYNATLPEGSRGSGVMDLSEKEHLKKCARYVRLQQCSANGSCSRRGEANG